MRNVCVLVLGGGRGTRLFPLTKYRSKPAVPLAGKYRLIDIPLSNCINSGLNHIYVLTQFNSVSLHRHIRSTYIFDAFDGGFVEILAAQQTMEEESWYQGTADAVRQNLRTIQQPGIEYVLILSGDQLYRMDYREMLAVHRSSRADVTIATLPVHRREAKSLGILRMDEEARVTGFLEKPQTEEEVKLVLTDPSWIDARGVVANGRDCLANMGIYLFNRDTLVDVLEKTGYRDFGKEIFPAAIRTRRVFAHMFDGYWEDIGTIRSFYEANLALAQKTPPFVLQSPTAPIYSRARFLPPTRFEGATVRDSLVADGCTIESGCTIENSVIGLRCHIESNVTIRNSIIMGSDTYQTAEQVQADQAAGRPRLGIGANSVIEQSIVDKNTRVGRNVRITNERGVEQSNDHPPVYIEERVVVVPRDAVLPDGWKL